MGLVQLYTTTHKDMAESVKAVHGDKQEIDAHEGLKEQKRQKRGSFNDQGKQTKRATMPTAGAMNQLKIPTRKFFAPLRAADMEVEHTEENGDQIDGDHRQQSQNSQRGRPPPILLTSAINLIQLQKQLKGFVKGNFEITRNGGFFSHKRALQLPKSKLFHLLSYIPEAYEGCYPTSARQHACRGDLRGTGGTWF
jgi:hypothetical protein